MTDVFCYSTAKIWDLRNLKSGGKSNKWLDQIVHSKNVYSAYFSPLTGNHILTTSLDGTLKWVVKEYGNDSKYYRFIVWSFFSWLAELDWAL